MGSYFIALAVNAPANLVLPRSSGAIASGTVWQGDATLPGGDRLRWRWSPLASLWKLGFAANWTLSGKRTDLSGNIVALPGTLRLADVRGRLSAMTLSALAPELPFTCDMLMTVGVPRLTLGGTDQLIAGSVRTRPGVCWAKGAASPATTIPPLILQAEDIGDRGTLMWITPLAGQRRDLVSAALSRSGPLDLSVTAEGAAMLPFAVPPGGLKLSF